MLALMEADVISREELYELVWCVPMVKVAEKFKVSGSYMARVCANLSVPRPEREHPDCIADKTIEGFNH